MDNHVRKIFNKFKPAFGYLQVFKGRLPAQTLGDVESGLLNARRIRPTYPTVEHAPSPQSSGSLEDTRGSHVDHPALFPNPNEDRVKHEDISQQQSTDHRVEDAPQPPSIRSLEANQKDPVDLPAANQNPDNDHIKNKNLLQPQFTEGPSRFVLAKDGSRDCVALLVNENLLAKLQDLFDEKRDLNLLDGPLYHARKDTSNIERSMQRAQENLETAESEQRADGYRKILEQNGPELLQTRQRRHELQKEYEMVRGNHEFSTNHMQWVLETAMREANLRRPEKPLPAILVRQEEVESAEHDTEVSEDEIEVPEHTMPPQSPVASVGSNHTEPPANPEDLERKVARITRALIEVEEEFEVAREHAQDLGAIGSDYGQEFYYGAEYEESWPENKIADYNSSHDWGFIHDWMDNIPNATSQSDTESVEIDEWDAEEVDVNDSISVIDREDYRQDIERYRRICARLEDPCPEVRWLGQPDAQPLERRYSFWM